jgi:hypothetical protein
MRTSEVYKIADAHIKARTEGEWGESPRITNTKELIEKLKEGFLYEQVLEEVEIRFVSTYSLIVVRSMGSVTETYKNSIRKGFRVLLQGEG